MPLSQANRVEVGKWYVAEIQRRIKVRKEAAERAKIGPDEREKVIRAAGETAAKAHRLGTVLIASIEHHKRDPVADAYGPALRVIGVDGLSIQIPLRLLPNLAANLDVAQAPKDLARKACQEVEFLTSMLGNGPIAGFQSYVGKLYAGQTTMPGPSTLTQMLDDYLTARRPAVCKIA